MAKIQKHLSRAIGSKSYSKYVIVIPPKVLKMSELKAGDEVEFESIPKGKGFRVIKKT